MTSSWPQQDPSMRTGVNSTSCKRKGYSRLFQEQQQNWRSACLSVRILSCICSMSISGINKGCLTYIMIGMLASIRSLIEKYWRGMIIWMSKACKISVKSVVLHALLLLLPLYVTIHTVEIAGTIILSKILSSQKYSSLLACQPTALLIRFYCSSSRKYPPLLLNFTEKKYVSTMLL